MARKFKTTFLYWTRALHTYATMLALILLIFFSFTGFVMNHGGWFKIDDFTEVNQTAKADLPAPLVAARGGKGTEHGYQVEAYLRQNEGARGELTGFDDLDDAIAVQFTGVGRKMEYSINRALPAAPATGPATEGGSAAPAEGAKRAGQIDEHFEIRNTLALMSDLHKGTGSGGAWRLFIDATAIFLAFASLSGVILWISLPKRRMLGIVALAASVVLCGACYLFMLA